MLSMKMRDEYREAVKWLKELGCESSEEMIAAQQHWIRSTRTIVERLIEENTRLEIQLNQTAFNEEDTVEFCMEYLEEYLKRHPEKDLTARTEWAEGKRVVVQFSMETREEE